MSTLSPDNVIRIGFLPLTDCAPLAVAKELGIFSKWGIRVELAKQNSWSALRDKVQAGVLDAGQMLAPMPLASTLGLGGIQSDIIVPFIMSRNGNAITVSEHLRHELLECNSLKDLPLPLPAGLLKNVIGKRNKNGTRVRLATVYPYSCHYYQLVSWFAQSRMQISEVDLLIIPPENMVSALLAGDIDGFCVGGPWNAKAVREVGGTTGLTSSDIWPDFPEKVLGINKQWYQQETTLTHRLILALKESCDWLQTIPNRFEAARLLSRAQYLNMPVDIIAPSLLGSCLTHNQGQPRSIPSYNLFSEYHSATMNSPDYAYGDWILNQMIMAGHVDEATPDGEVVKQVFRPDIYQAAIRTESTPSESF